MHLKMGEGTVAGSIRLGLLDACLWLGLAWGQDWGLIGMSYTLGFGTSLWLVLIRVSHLDGMPVFWTWTCFCSLEMSH